MDPSESQEVLCEQARLLGFPGPHWGSAQARMVYRLVRESCPEVWKTACQALGQRASWDRLARAEVLELLASPCAELRLRGVWALPTRSCADDSGDTLAFLEARLEEAATRGDAVLLDAVVRSLLRVEGQAGLLAQDPREVVRAALAVHACELAAGHLEDLAGDESMRVRVALASSLGNGPDWPATLAWQLAADPDAEVRATLAESLDPEDPALQPLRAVLMADRDPLVVEAVQATPQSLRTLPDLPWASADLGWPVQQEEVLFANPERPLDALRPVLESADRALLERLAQTARDPDLGAVCRAAAALDGLGGQFPAHARTHLLEALGCLPEASVHEGVRQLRSLLAACVRAAEVEDVAELRAWDPGDPEEMPGGPAGEALLQLQDISGNLTSIDCAALCEAAALLDDLRVRIEADLPEPERSMLCLVVQTWSETLQQGIDRLLAGART